MEWTLLRDNKYLQFARNNRTIIEDGSEGEEEIRYNWKGDNKSYME